MLFKSSQKKKALKSKIKALIRNECSRLHQIAQKHLKKRFIKSAQIRLNKNKSKSKRS